MLGLLLPLPQQPAHGATSPSTPNYLFEFDGNFSSTIGTATFGPRASCANWSCTTSTSWGTSNNDGYWQWSGASGNGPGLSLSNYLISDTYTIILKFSVGSLGSYTRIINYNEGDNGVYLIGGLLTYYNYSTAAAPTYVANQEITMAITRSPQYITIYTSDSSTSATTQRIQFASSNIGRASILSSLLFFTDDGSEYATTGKFFKAAIWGDRALTLSEINSYLYTPLTPSLSFSSAASTAPYRTTTQLGVNTNLPGKTTFYQSNKKIAGCIGVSTVGSADTFTATCNWKPSLHGSVSVKAIFTPTDLSFPVMTILKQYAIENRATQR